ncbi:MAG TPA: TrmO family methyltransferase [Gemmatimonadaceae bacterium]|nr:TrmO family methyltransferase [Gemmatimonadaceae bacterium]
MTDSISDTSPDTSLRCQECGRAVAPADARMVDGQPLCLRCLFGDVPPLAVWPIGVVRNALAREGPGVQIGRQAHSEIHLVPGMRRFLSGLSEEKALTVVWYAHAARALETTFARGLDGKIVGPFAARTPARPNAIAITEVTVIELRDLVLVVHGLDAIDGTPVLDLKWSRGTG